MTVLYNEFDKNAAAWLRELISMGAIADGYVDQRSILELTPSDIRKYRCAHFFAGIGGWSYALRLAGIPDDYPVWTASLPCQPFSCAGKQLGKNDERHLLPHFLELVRECRPNIIFGEQVEGAIRHGWLDDLQTTMEREGYAVGHCVLGAHSVGAPHIRQRLYWVAHSESIGLERWRSEDGSGKHSGCTDVGLAYRKSERCGETWNPETGPEKWPSEFSVFSGLANSGGEGLQEQHGLGRISSGAHGYVEGENASGSFGVGDTESEQEQPSIQGGFHTEFSGECFSSGVGDTDSNGREARRKTAETAGHRDTLDAASWHGCDWLYCRDGKYRPIKSGLAPLVGKFKPGAIEMADGLSRGMVHSGDPSITPNETAEARAMRLKGYGNAIVPQTAAEFIKAVFEALDLY